MLTFDARLRDGLAIGLPIMTDEAQSPQTRTMAALAAVGAQYWLGRTGEAMAHADVMAAVTTTPQARQAVPYGAASIELLAVCALLEQGDLDAAEQRSQRMRREGAATHDPFGGPRGEYCLGRVALARGKAGTAVRRFRRCLAAVSPFDQFIVRHLNSMLARAAASVGDLGCAASALQAGAVQPRMKPYEPEWELAEAAVLAAGLRMDEAALAHAGNGDLRAARASGQRSADYRAACEGAVSPWLTGALSAIPLTPRERQIAALAAQGHTDLAIAGRLHISTRTVQTHLAHVYAKLGINRRSGPGQPSEMTIRGRPGPSSGHR